MDQNDHSATEAGRTSFLYASIGTLLNSDKFCDMIILCGTREFRAHRAVVCTHSSFFDRVAAGSSSEAVTGPFRVSLPDDNPHVFELFLQFLYTGTYQDHSHPKSAKAVEASMMSPEEVVERLRSTPGVPHIPFPIAGDGAQRKRKRADDDGDGTSDTEDGSFRSEFSDGDPGGPPEPEEEYYSKSDDENESEISEDEDAHAPLTKRRHKLARRLGCSKNADHDDFFLDEMRVRHNLYLPLRLYIMADKFDVPALKLLARDRFYRAAELSWRDIGSFPFVVDELYTRTPATEVTMREIVCRLVASGINEDTQRARMEWVMRKHGDFAVGVMNYMIQAGRLLEGQDVDEDDDEEEDDNEDGDENLE